MKVLIIGSGGREHALAWRIKQSPLVSGIFCAPGNGGIGMDVSNISLAAHGDIAAFCKKENIGLAVVGAETPLVEGLADTLEASNIPVFGPSAKAAQLEGSKGFTKRLCRKYNIPTADYECFTDPEAAVEYIRRKGAPIVVKADGLAAGKGVVVAMTVEEAVAAVHDIMRGKFGAAGASVVIEEFMEGEEVSFFATAGRRWNSAPPRITSAPMTATRGRIPGEWARIRRLPSWAKPCAGGLWRRLSIPRCRQWRLRECLIGECYSPG
jgi:phosphoribosylamine--glycine ligase